MKKTAIISVKKFLNKFHIDLGQQGFTQVEFLFLYYYSKICELIVVND
jgi:hypothetical protein